MQNDNSMKWLGGIVAVLVIVGIIFFVLKNNQKVAPVVIQEVPVQNNTEPDSDQDTTSSVVTGKVAISYADALVKYADRRIQLDTICQAHPNNVTYKDNTGIMIDNRSPNTRTVKVGTTFTIKPYGFKIVVLPDIYLKAKTLLVDCDASQNVATILVQE